MSRVRLGDSHVLSAVKEYTLKERLEKWDIKRETEESHHNRGWRTHVTGQGKLNDKGIMH